MIVKFMFPIKPHTQAPSTKWREGLVHTVCACATYSIFLSVKKNIVHLPSPHGTYAEYYTNHSQAPPTKPLHRRGLGMSIDTTVL